MIIKRMYEHQNLLSL